MQRKQAELARHIEAKTGDKDDPGWIGLHKRFMEALGLSWKDVVAPRARHKKTQTYIIRMHV